MNEESQTKKVIKFLSLWVSNINLNSSVDFYDINKVSENLAANLLNQLYDYQLRNLNDERRNFPAVDLGCDIKKVAFQITSTTETDKIKSTLEKFIEHKLQHRFINGVRFLLLTTEKINTTSSNNKKYQAIYADFNSDVHILTIHNVIQDILRLYNTNNEKFCKILKLLEREFSSESSDIAEIVKILTANHQQETQAKDEQIKALTHAITALSQGKGVIGTEAEINSAFDALKRGDTTEAKKLFTQAAEKSESVIQAESLKSAEIYRNLGALAFWDNTQEALNAYRRVTELEPDNADGWNELGNLLIRTGELNKAIDAYQKVWELGKLQKNNELIAMACNNLGVIYSKLSELDKAVDFFFKALKINVILEHRESIAEGYVNIGLVYQNIGKLDDAIEYFNKALKIDESINNKRGMADDYSNLGEAYRIKGKLSKALEFYRKALTIYESLNYQKGIANNYSNLGVAFLSSMQLDNAIEFYNKSLKINEKLFRKENIAINCEGLGAAYAEKGNKAEAKRYWQRSIELYINSPRVKIVQGWLDALQ